MPRNLYRYPRFASRSHASPTRGAIGCSGLFFAGRANGKTLEIAIATYASTEAFEASASAMSTDVQQGSFTVEIQTTEIQSIDTAHEYGKLAYEQMGYEVIIDMV